MEVGKVMLLPLSVTLLPSIRQNDWAMLIMYLSLLCISVNTLSGVRSGLSLYPSAVLGPDLGFHSPTNARSPGALGWCLESGLWQHKSHFLWLSAETRCSLTFSCGCVSGLYLRQNSHSSCHCKEQTLGGAK